MTYVEVPPLHEDEIGRIWRYLSPDAQSALLTWPEADEEALKELRRRGLAVPGALTVLGERVRKKYRKG